MNNINLKKIIFLIILVILNFKNIKLMEDINPRIYEQEIFKKNLDLPDYISLINLNIFTKTEVTREELIEELNSFISNQQEKFKNNCPYEIIKNTNINSEIIWIGDIHGNYPALYSVLQELIKLNYLNTNYKLINPNNYIVFTGDYVDRGFWSEEILIIILKLLKENENNVFLIKGNHEDLNVNRHYIQYSPDYSNKELKIKLLNTFYNMLPYTVYLGSYNSEKNKSKYILFCHGMLPKQFDILTEQAPYQTPVLPNNITPILFRDISIFSNINQFLWNDFDENCSETISSPRGLGNKLCIKDINFFLSKFPEETDLIGICRGHDHTENFKNNPTLNIAPVFTSILSYTDMCDPMPKYMFCILNIDKKEINIFTKINFEYLSLGSITINPTLNTYHKETFIIPNFNKI